MPPAPEPPDDVERLARLFQRRWIVPVLAELLRGGGAKFITLGRRLSASPNAVRLALDDLIARGWVRANPGYGHPLRPEYILTPAGAELAPACGRLYAALQRLDLLEIGLQKWSMPVLYTVQGGKCRFNALADRLGPITDRALSIALRDLTAAQLLERRIEADYPPRPEYGVTRVGRRLAAIVGEALE